ncbi:RNA polymerase subunit sigma-70 [Nocardiopsis sp. CNR-923]|uniref:RNA polymerase subunit sigma-70 n=1 Tax=Nocardiopsis sp. CNR-923 TaxID=1904965 RepID=UPI00095FE5F7|nr:RNA polymerase subunit sigma-70 [Nocardiopsis sp. CNR-923]OLT29714.1 RNA polymerase subunit sigma-70 [Nocardiopsis sp. CNR-923]
MLDAHRIDDEAAFADVAERHRHELRVHCYRMTGSFTEAEDMVQEALLRAWRNRATFEGRSTFRAWLYRIATNVCLDALSRRRPNPDGATPHGSPFREVTWLQPYPDELLDRAGSEEEGPEARAISRETVELAFLATLQHLPPRQRAVLILRDVVGWPAEQTAGALEMTVPSVKSALQRARATLRRVLPPRRSDWSPATAPTENERRVLRRFVEASQNADLDALADLLRQDARQTMPPASLVYDGRAAILDLWRPVLTGDRAWGAWISVPLAANRQPGVANYTRAPGEREFTAVNVDVLRIEDGLVAEITTFGPQILPAFGLPPTRER